MASDNGSLLHENFDYSIENLRVQGQLKESDAIEVDQDDLVNIVGNVVGEVEIVDRENKDGTAFRLSISLSFQKMMKVIKLIQTALHMEKGEIPKDFKQGDFVKLFGQLQSLGLMKWQNIPMFVYDHLNC